MRHENHRDAVVDIAKTTRRVRNKEEEEEENREGNEAVAFRFGGLLW